MSLVTTLRYGAITGDVTTAASAVSALIDEATDMLAEELGRPLTSQERTETMWPSRDGRWVFPLAVPITVAEGYRIEGDGLRSTAPFANVTSAPFESTDTVSVTYTGGFVEPTANVGEPNALPRHLERDIAWAAYALGHVDEILSSIPAGATSISVGDLSVSFGPGASGASNDDMTIKWSRVTRRHRRRGL